MRTTSNGAIGSPQDSIPESPQHLVKFFFHQTKNLHSDPEGSEIGTPNMTSAKQSGDRRWPAPLSSHRPLPSRHMAAGQPPSLPATPKALMTLPTSLYQLALPPPLSTLKPNPFLSSPLRCSHPSHLTSPHLISPASTAIQFLQLSSTNLQPRLRLGAGFFGRAIVLVESNYVVQLHDRGECSCFFSLFQWSHMS
jgi:hypothetical protein